MNSIRRLLGEADEPFAPLLAASSAVMMARQRRARPLFRQAGEEEAENQDEPKPTRESVSSELKSLGESLRGTELDKFSGLVIKLAESISVNSLVPFDAEITVSTTQQTTVVTQPKPPEKDPVLAAILGKEKPVETKPPLEQTQKENNQKFSTGPEDAAQQAQPKPPGQKSPQEVQKAYEDALLGIDTKPQMELVESSGMSSAMSMLQMESLPSAGPILGSPATGNSGQVWGAFKRFVKQ